MMYVKAIVQTTYQGTHHGGQISFPHLDDGSEVSIDRGQRGRQAGERAERRGFLQPIKSC